MRKFIILIAVLLVSLQMAFAQDVTGLVPGIYIETADNQFVPMSFETGADIRASVGDDFSDETLELYKKYKYRGSVSGNRASGSFIVVCNPHKKAFVRTLKKYDVFIESLTPENMIIVRFEQLPKSRIFDVNSIRKMLLNSDAAKPVDFSWEKIGDYVYRITLPEGTPAGEYGFAFRLSKIASYDFGAQYTFGYQPE